MVIGLGGEGSGKIPFSEYHRIITVQMSWERSGKRLKASTFTSKSVVHDFALSDCDL